MDNNAATLYLVDTLREDLQLGDFKCESFTDVFILVNIPAYTGRRVWVMKRSREYYFSFTELPQNNVNHPHS